jgi:predicted lipid-binding transport protein (Tim44 family)
MSCGSTNSCFETNLCSKAKKHASTRALKVKRTRARAKKASPGVLLGVILGVMLGVMLGVLLGVLFGTANEGYGKAEGGAARILTVDTVETAAKGLNKVVANEEP